MVNSDFLPSEVRTKKYVIFILFSLWHMKRNSYSKIIVFLLIKRRPYTLNFTQAKKMHIIYIVFVHVVTRFILELSLTFSIFFLFIFFVFLVMCQARIIIGFLPPNWLDIWLPFQNDTKKKFHWLMTLLQLNLSFSF